MEVWKESIRLVPEVYALISNFPPEEKYGLSSQVSRSAVSIPSNIAEGCGRSSEKEFARFLEISLGSAYELETQIWVAIALKFLTKVQGQEVIDKVVNNQKRISALIRTVRTAMDN